MEHGHISSLNGTGNGTRLSNSKKTVYLFALLLAISAPQRSFAASPEKVIAMMQSGEWTNARAAVVQSGNPVLYKLYEWMLYRKNIENLPFDPIITFIRRNPDWPDRDELLATAERNMPDGIPAAQVIGWFTQYPPVTGDGIERLVNAGVQSGQTGTVAAILARAWPTASVTKEGQSEVLTRFGGFIPPSAEEARLDTLLKNQEYTLARALASALRNGYPQLVEARIALVEDKSNAPSLLSLVPAHLQDNSGLTLDRARRSRKNDDNERAAQLLNAGNNFKTVTFPEDWWKERHILVRRLMEDGHYRKAYDLARQHRSESGPDYAEAEWMCGWLALRFLGQPTVAMKHFTQMYNKVETAISKSRGAYWSGRAAEALNQPDIANQWYNEAAKYPHTYYGQVALVKLRRPSPTRTAAIATAEDTRTVTSLDMVQAAVYFYKGGYVGLSNKFINAELDRMQSPGEFQAFATYMKRIGNTAGAYRIAKRASWKNIFLGDTAYPSLMSMMTGLSVDPALAHGVIRQESQFDVGVESPAGAKGLMQLMPATAREVARKRGWDHRTEWLTNKPEHNILLGAAYLNDLLKRFNGSYPLAIAAYNAGPGRVNGWLETFGDPRTGKVDWIDWIEMIPVAETRNYVQRVMEGVVTYRDHLGMVKR